MDIASTTSFLYTWPIEWLVLAGLAIFIVVGTIRGGTGAATGLALAFPMTALLYSQVSSAFLIGSIASNNQPMVQAIVVGVLFMIVFIMLYRIVTCFDSLTGGSVFGVLAALSVAILLIVTWLSIPALNTFYHVSAPVAALFAEQFRFWWTFVALGILVYVRS